MWHIRFQQTPLGPSAPTLTECQAAAQLKDIEGRIESAQARALEPDVAPSEATAAKAEAEYLGGEAAILRRSIGDTRDDRKYFGLFRSRVDFVSSRSALCRDKIQRSAEDARTEAGSLRGEKDIEGRIEAAQARALAPDAYEPVAEQAARTEAEYLRGEAAILRQNAAGFSTRFFLQLQMSMPRLAPAPEADKKTEPSKK